ncbi:hypothetical protein DVH24_025928 [Malus domestica]|uniref:Uncharacterized protein n=1 Tax=Malus domestica TaxID=3750 RepID=A0A498KMA9_MALDO|nr:hypothetical protein DVH24_025928 [Malus domestica]
MRANTYKAQGQPSRRRCGILQSTPLRETDVLVGTPNGRESGSDTKQYTTPSSAEILSALWWNPAHRSDPTHGFLQNASLKSTCERIHIRPKDSPHVVDVGYYNPPLLGRPTSSSAHRTAVSLALIPNSIPRLPSQRYCPLCGGTRRTGPTPLTGLFLQAAAPKRVSEEYMRANTYKAQGQPSRRRCGILQSTPLRETDVLVGTPNGRESGSDTKQYTTPSSAEILSALWWNLAHRSDPTHGFVFASRSSKTRL